MSGRPSRLCGRAQARVPRMGASATAGTNLLARARIRSIQAAGIRPSGEERRADRGDPVERHEAEVDQVGLVAVGQLGPRPDRGADLGLLEDVGRAGRELRLDDDAPALADRPPGAGRVDQRRRPRPRRDQHRVGSIALAIDDHADDCVAAPRSSDAARPIRTRDPAALGDRRVGVGRGGGCDRKADADPAAPHVRRDRRLDGAQVRALGDDPVERPGRHRPATRSTWRTAASSADT